MWMLSSSEVGNNALFLLAAPKRLKMTKHTTINLLDPPVQGDDMAGCDLVEQGQ